MVQKAPNVPFCALPKRDKLDGVQTSFPMAGDTYQAKRMCSIWTEGRGRVEAGRVEAGVRGGVMVGVAPPIREDVWNTRQPPRELLDNLAEQLRLSDFSADASRPS